MVRVLQVRFHRDPSRDRERGRIRYEGYELLWPDGTPVTVGVEAFCQHGQRLLGLGRHLAGRRERLVELLCFPLRTREDDLTRLTGHRVRRFCLERLGQRGCLHFLDGTPTDVAFEVGRDDLRVLHWVGLATLAEGERHWLDVAARPVEESISGGETEGGRPGSRVSAQQVMTGQMV